MKVSESADYYIKLENKYGANNYIPLPVVISKANGLYVWDTDGKKYIDLLSAYSAMNHGHLHPKIVEIMKEQLDILTLTSRAFHNCYLGPFLKKLCEFCGMEKALPMNTGAEAVETGIKICRRWGYRVKGVEPNRAEIVVCENNFHGRTTTIVGFSSSENAYKDFGPETPGFIKIPFNDVIAFKNVINKNTVGFLVEPIQGEGGVIVPDDNYLNEIGKICEENNILLILDEIQTGFGRTGKKFAFNYSKIQPDILLVGKALGGGVFPVSAALTRKNIMDVITPSSHGSTFGGNPLASIIGIKSMEILEEENLIENSEKMGNYFISKLKSLQLNKIKEIRGKGLMIAIEIKESEGIAKIYVEKLMKRGILTKDTRGQTIRIAPPLCINEKVIDEVISIIEEVFSQN